MKEECNCIVGYKIDLNTKKCIDIDECAEGKHNCSQICHNQIGSYDCECNTQYGFYFLSKNDNYTCVRNSTIEKEPIWLIFAHGQSIWNVSDDGKFVELKISGLEKTAMLDLDLKVILISYLKVIKS